MKPPQSKWLGCFRAFRNKYLAALIITALLFTTEVSGQVLIPILGFGFEWKAGQFDSMLNIPTGGAADTLKFTSKYRRFLKPGAAVFDSVNHARWIYWGGSWHMESTGAAQIQTDWNQTTSSALDFIKNKPVLANVATSGAWGDLSGYPTTLLGYGITDAVPSNRTLSINGVAYDLTANRSWLIGAGGFTLTTSGTSGPATYIGTVLNIPQYTGFTNPMTTPGDIIYGGIAGAGNRLGIGATNQVLTVIGGVPVWSTPASGFADPLTTNGDIIARISGATSRLGLGSNGTFLGVVGGVLGYYTPVGSVTAVNGTTNRITSTGGATPALDISSTFESLLGKVASPLSQFASTSSSQFAGIISDESGSGNVVFNTAPVFSAPRLSSTSTTNYVWTATDNLGNGNWQAAASGFADPLATNGDIIARISGVTTRLPKGANNTVLLTDGSGLVGYNLLVNANLSGSAAISNANLATMAAHTRKGNVTASAAVPTDVTSTQETADLNLFTSTLQGLVPASGGGTLNFLRADGTFAPPPSGFANPMTSVGDIIYGTTAGAASRIGIGATNQVLTVIAGVPSWQTPSAGFADPLTTNGDIIARISGATTRLAQGANGKFLGVSGGVLGYFGVDSTVFLTVSAYNSSTSTYLVRNVGAGTGFAPLVYVNGLSLVSANLIPAGGTSLTVNADSGVTITTYLDPLTTDGDIVARVSGTTNRIGKGADGTFLGVKSGTLGYYFPKAISHMITVPNTADYTATFDGQFILQNLAGATNHIFTFAAADSRNTYWIKNNSQASSGFTWSIAGRTVYLNDNTVLTAFASETDYIITDDGVNLNVMSQTPSGGSGYSLPTASTSTLGGVKVDGTTITISAGVISATGASSSLTRQYITTGTSATFTGSNYVMWFNLTSAASAFTVTMPASPVDQQRVVIRGGGTLTYGSEVNSLTVVPNTSQSIVGTPVTYVTVADNYEWEWNSSLSQWHRTH